MRHAADPLAYNATIIEREDLSPTLARFVLRPDHPSAAPRFVAGQFMVIGLNDEDQPQLGGVRRPMSVASSPRRTDAYEFYVRRVSVPTSAHPFTRMLWTRGVGDRIYLNAIGGGTFTLAEIESSAAGRLVIMVAAGTGLAPFVSIVRARVDAGRRLDDLALLHGASYEVELGYRHELERFAEEAGLRYLPTLSRAPAGGEWRGATGRVEDFFRADRLADSEAHLGLPPQGLTPDRCELWVCGLAGTIAAVVERCLPLGFAPAQARLRELLEIPPEQPASIRYEKYDDALPFDLHDPGEVERLRALARAGRTSPSRREAKRGTT